jgi:uncharacterized protein YkwD
MLPDCDLPGRDSEVKLGGNRNIGWAEMNQEMVNSRTSQLAFLLGSVTLVLGNTGCGGSGALGLGTLGSTTAGDSEHTPAVALVLENQNDLIRDVISGVNRQRAKHSTAEIRLEPLTPDLQLSEIADDYARVMIEEGFFSHQHPISGDGPDDRALACGYAGKAIGENLAVGIASPSEVVRAWMESPDHKAAILNPQWREIGIGVRQDHELGLLWVCEFGVPR